MCAAFFPEAVRWHSLICRGCPFISRLAEDQLKRTDIRAPQDGIVFQSTANTVGGVIAAGDPIMPIVPESDNLTVEVKVDPKDIDQVQLGQTALEFLRRHRDPYQIVALAGPLVGRGVCGNTRNRAVDLRGGADIKRCEPQHASAM